MNLKQCTKCLQYKETSEFNKDSKSKDKLNTQCRSCKNKAWQNWKNNHPDKIYQIKYPDKAKKSRLNWRAKNRDRERQVGRQWQINNPQKVIASFHRRRAHIKGNGGSYTENEWVELCKLYDNRCLCCQEYKTLTVDHVIPISKGGKNSINNIQPLCRECNSSKGTKIIDYRNNQKQPELHSLNPLG